MTTKPEAIGRIEAALAAGPTDGPWRAEQLEANDGTSFPSFTAMPSGRFHHDPQVDADYIVACNPAAMREVLDHIAAQDAEIARLRDDLIFVERWANHHGQKPHVTPQEALSCIQHYPPISAITKGYEDGKVPETFDPYVEIARLREALEDLFDADMEHVLMGDGKDDQIAAIAKALTALTTKEPS